MLYIYRYNDLAAKKLQEMGCMLTPTTKNSGYYDYDCEWVEQPMTVLRVDGWKGSGHAFSRFLKENGLRWYQQKEAEREAAAKARRLEAERVIAEAAAAKVSEENRLLEKRFGTAQPKRTEEEKDFLNQLYYEEEYYWMYGG